MDRNVRRLLNRVSVVFATIATASLFHLFHHSSRSCFSSSVAYSHLTLSRYPFPKSSCDAFSRRVSAPETRFAKLRSSRSYHRRVHSLSGSVFDHIRSLHLLSNSSHVLCVSAGAGHAVDALQNSGVMDVTGVDLIDYPPLVKRADPHNLPFFDDVFDLGFSDGLAGALYPVRFVSELERTVRRGGAVVLVVARKVAKVEEVAGLFKRLNLLEVRSVKLDGSKMNLIIMKNNGTKSSLPNLNYLSLPNPEIQEDEFFIALPKFESLTGLAIDQYFGQSVNILSLLQKHCPYLTEFKLFGQEDRLEHHHAMIICYYLPNLRKLEIPIRLSRGAILAFLEELHGLEYLDISGYQDSVINNEILEKASRLKVFIWHSGRELGEFVVCSNCGGNESVTMSCQCALGQKMMEWLADP